MSFPLLINQVTDICAFNLFANEGWYFVAVCLGVSLPVLLIDNLMTKKNMTLKELLLNYKTESKKTIMAQKAQVKKFGSMLSTMSLKKSQKSINITAAKTPLTSQKSFYSSISLGKPKKREDILSAAKAAVKTKVPKPPRGSFFSLLKKRFAEKKPSPTFQTTDVKPENINTFTMGRVKKSTFSSGSSVNPPNVKSTKKEFGSFFKFKFKKEPKKS